MVPETAIAGVESALWSETVSTDAAVDYMAFPSGGDRRDRLVTGRRSVVDGYRQRIAAQAARRTCSECPRLRPDIPWSPA
jgi:hexosaminidase